MIECHDGYMKTDINYEYTNSNSSISARDEKSTYNGLEQAKSSIQGYYYDFDYKQYQYIFIKFYPDYNDFKLILKATNSDPLVIYVTIIVAVIASIFGKVIIVLSTVFICICIKKRRKNFG